MSTEYGPCEDWPIRWQCDFDCESPEITGEAVSVASEILWGLSGRQFGLCTVTLRPCRSSCWDGSFGMPYWGGLLPSVGSGYPYPALVGGQWFNLGCGGCAGECSCTRISEVKLPAPVYGIVEVKIDGEIVPTGSYRLDNERLLVRTDGGEWPLCNDASKDDTEVGTWSVTMEFGRPVPKSAEWAMGELACQLVKALSGEDCRLPANVTQLVRQGVTISMPDPTELFGRGATGLYLVDLFVSTVNPNHLAEGASMIDIDRPFIRRPGA